MASPRSRRYARSNESAVRGYQSSWTRRAFTKEYKAEVVDLIRRSGRAVGEGARALDLTETAVRNWGRYIGTDPSEIDMKKLGPCTDPPEESCIIRAKM